MDHVDPTNRRAFLRHALGAGVALSAVGVPLAAWAEDARKPDEAPVYPPEDLMREHGVLNRVMLIFDEVRHRLATKQDVDPRHLDAAAGVIQDFIEGYHEKLEEEHLFPRLEQAGKLVDLVHVLQSQHKAGHPVTARIRALAGRPKLDAEERRDLADLLAAFNRMYRPHEAREDTVLFPTFRDLVPAQELDALGDRFEAIEHQRFGKAGFEGVVVHVADIEKALGIYDLAQFTPR